MIKLLQKIFNCLVMNYEISHGLRDVNGNYIEDYNDRIYYMKSRL